MTEPRRGVVIRPTDDIKRRLLAGESLTTLGTAADYGCSRALLGSVVTTLRHEGVVIQAAKRDDGTSEYVVTYPEPTGEPHGPARGVRKMPGRGAGTKQKPEPPASPLDAPAKAQPPAKRAKQRNGVVPTLPALDASVRVCLLAIGDDGRVSIGFRGDAGTWLTSVDGFSASDDA